MLFLYNTFYLKNILTNFLKAILFKLVLFYIYKIY